MGVYADHAATTPLDPAALDAMIPFLSGNYHNPSSLYAKGRAVRNAIEEARALIAGYLGCDSGEIYFTSGGTEAANLAVLGAVRSAGRKGRVLIGATEHYAVGKAAAALVKEGFSVVTVPCDGLGRITPEALARNITDDTVLVSIMWANNETGMIQPVGELCRVARRHGAIFHTDAVQALGSQRIRVDESGIDLLSISSHKIYGPKGCGALFIRRGTPIAPIIYGGSQEKHIRAGTENPAAVAGFGKAVELLSAERESRVKSQRLIARRFMEKIAGTPGILCNSPQDLVVPGFISLSIAGVESEPLLLLLGASGIDASMGAACNAETIEPSFVLRAMGVPKSHIHGSVRFSFGRDNTFEDADFAADTLTAVIRRLRKLN